MSPRMELGLECCLRVPGLTLYCQEEVGDCSGLGLGVLRIKSVLLVIIGAATENGERM